MPVVASLPPQSASADVAPATRSIFVLLIIADAANNSQADRLPRGGADRAACNFEHLVCLPLLRLELARHGYLIGVSEALHFLGATVLPNPVVAQSNVAFLADCTGLGKVM
jgi:hypothetical protein